MAVISRYSSNFGRPRMYSDNAQKMRFYRREKRIRFWMDLYGVSREVAIDWIRKGRRINSPSYLTF